MTDTFLYWCVVCFALNETYICAFPEFKHCDGFRMLCTGQINACMGYPRILALPALRNLQIYNFFFRNFFSEMNPIYINRDTLNICRFIWPVLSFHPIVGTNYHPYKESVLNRLKMAYF